MGKMLIFLAGVFYETIINYWLVIVIILALLVGLFVFLTGAAEGAAEAENSRMMEEIEEEARKHGISDVSLPEKITVGGPLISGEISDIWPSVRAAVFTIKTLNGHGSGFVFGKNGWVLTNSHVVGEQMHVMLKAENDESEFPGTVVHSMEEYDVALIKIPNKMAPSPLPVNFSTPKVGDDVYSVGTPLDESLECTLAEGVVSAIRAGNHIDIDAEFVIQSTATIHGGNSGGPLMDKYGNVIGIAVAGRTDSNSSINYFIPIKEIKHLPIKFTKQRGFARFFAFRQN